MRDLTTSPHIVLLPGEMEAIRAVVADAVARGGHGNRDFIADLRAGGQDDGPFMRGAVAGFALGVVMGVSDHG